jgi:hypothetical protein
VFWVGAFMSEDRRENVCSQREPPAGHDVGSSFDAEGCAGCERRVTINQKTDLTNPAARNSQTQLIFRKLRILRGFACCSRFLAEHFGELFGHAIQQMRGGFAL